MRPGHGPCGYSTGEPAPASWRDTQHYPGANYAWVERRILWPRQCVFTGKWLLPFKLAVRGQPTPSNGYLTHVSLWSSPAELVIQKLKGNI